MLLDWIDNLGLLIRDPSNNPLPFRIANYLASHIDSDVLAILPIGIRQIIVAEVTNHVYESMFGPSGAAPEPAVISSTSIINSLSTDSHVFWIMEVIGQAFSLPIDDLNITSNAIKIYSAWLTQPKSRPAAVATSKNPQTTFQFIQKIVMQMTDLFAPKKMDPKQSALGAKHVDQCRQVLQTISSLFTSTTTASSMDSATKKAILRSLLGVTDYLLQVPLQPPSYISDELDETILSILMECWLRSELHSSKMWNALKLYYPRWMHRASAISLWSNLALALTRRITKLIYGYGTENTIFTSKNYTIVLSLPNHYTIYAWHQVLHLIGENINGLPPLIFHRAILGLERLVHVFHSVSGNLAILNEAEPTCNDEIKELYLSDGNTLLHIFGKWLFDAVNNIDPNYSDGRAQAFGIICRIMCKPQHRNPLLSVYLYQFYSALVDGLLAPDVHTLVFIIVNSEDLFSLSLPGARILFLPFLYGLRRIVPVLEKSLKVSFNIDDLRRACYKLLGALIGICDHYGEDLFAGLSIVPRLSELERMIGEQVNKPLAAALPPTTTAATTTTTTTVTSFRDDGPFSAELRSIFEYKGLEKVATKSLTLHGAKYLMIDTLLASLLVERDSGNQRYLLNTLSFAVYDDFGRFPGLAAISLKAVTQQLSLGKWSVEASLVGINVINHILAFGAVATQISYKFHRALLISICNFTNILISKNMISTVGRLLISLLECITRWIDYMCTGFSNDPELQTLLVHTITKFLSLSTSSAAASINQEAGITSTQSTTNLEQISKKGKKGVPISDGIITGTEGKLATGIVLTAPPGSGSLEMILVEAAEVAFARLFGTFGNEGINPLLPVYISSLLTDWQLEPKVLESAHFYLLNRTSIVCLLEPPSSIGNESRQTNPELLILARTPAGRFAWRNYLLYSERPLISSIEREDPSHDPDVEEPWSWPTSKFVYPNARLANENGNVASLSTEPLYNDELISERFLREERRVENFSVVTKLFTETIDREQTKRLTRGRALLNRRAREPDTADPRNYLYRLFVSQFGLANLNMRPFKSLLPLPICRELLYDLKELDEMGERERISCSVFFLKSGRQSIEDILSCDQISQDFLEFVNSLGWPVDLNEHGGWSGGLTTKHCKSAPYYANSMYEVIFHVPALINCEALCDTNTDPYETLPGALPTFATELYKLMINDFVSILWIEDLQDMITLPGKFQSTAMVYICIHPLLDPASNGIYRIRIMVTSGGLPNDTVFLFGPLLDGMLVRRNVLGMLVRETVIASTTYCMYNLQNRPKPLVKRMRLIDEIANRYAQPQSISKYAAWWLDMLVIIGIWFLRFYGELMHKNLVAINAK